MKKLLYSIVLVLVFCLGYRCGNSSRTAVVTHDTITIREAPIIKMCTVGVIKTRIAYRAMPTKQTISCVLDSLDSLDITLPRQQANIKTRQYEAYISGYQPRLDSITIFPIIKKPPRWSLGIHAGYGITPSGTQPYFGIGISYRLF